MCMVGQLQWAITLGRYDNLPHVMSMSRFRLAPKIRHLERIMRLYGYLVKTNILLSGIEPKNWIILTYQSKNMNGPGLFMEMLKKKSQMIFPNH